MTRRSRFSGVLLGVRLVSLVYVSSIGGLLFWSHAPVLVGWQPRVVLTGSMSPVIRPGDVALVNVVRPGEDLPLGRILLVRDPSRPSGFYLHRLVRYDDAGLMVTKGDANPTVDVPAIGRDRVAGQVRLLVPVVGAPLVWLRDGRRAEVGIVAVASWAAVALAIGLRTDGERPAGGGGGNRPAGGRRAARERSEGEPVGAGASRT